VRPDRLLRFPADLGKDPNASVEVARRNILNQFAAQPVRGVEDFFEDRLRPSLEVHNVAATVVRRFTPFHPTVLLQTIEQAGQGWLFNSHPFGDFFLSELVSRLGQVNESPPLSLAQAERAQTLIQLSAPGARRAEKKQTKLAGIGESHFEIR
jgi:hypothetical protein